MKTPPVLTFGDKVKIVSTLIDGTKPEFIADLYSTTVANINKIIEIHHQIIEVCYYFNISQHLPLRRGIYPRMENVLYCWFVDQRNVPNKVLVGKAKEILDILNEEPTLKNAAAFTGSNNWIRLFKARFGISADRQTSDNNGTTTGIFQSSSTYEEKDVETVIKTELEPPASEPANLCEMDLCDEFKAEPEQFQTQDIPMATEDTDEEIINAILAGHAQEDDDEKISVIRSQELLAGHAKAGDDTSHVQADDLSFTRFSEDENISTDLIDDASTTIDLTLQQYDDETVNDEEWTAAPTLNVKKRKRQTIMTEDQYSSSDSDASHKRRKRNGLEKVLVPSKKFGVISMDLTDYEEDKVIRIFKPLLKYARDSGWSEGDSKVLDKLYRKSLNSCGGKATQSTITQYFRKKK